MTEFVLVRHGETDWNASGRLHGSVDVPLNAAGRAQAEGLGEMLALTSFDAIYTSPQVRAYATATAIGLANRHSEMDILVSDSLRERDFGDAEGTSLAERRSRWPDKQWPNAEPMETMYLRVRDVVNELQVQHSEGRILLVTHGSWIRSALRIASEFDPAIMNLSVPNASVTRILFDGSKFEIVEIGRVPRGREIHD